MVEVKCYDAWVDWCEKKTINNFKKVYTLTFLERANPVYRVYKIIKNTITGKYKNIINDPELIVNRKTGYIYYKNK